MIKPFSMPMVMVPMVPWPHRQAAGGLDEEHGHVAIRPRRRVEDGARHHVMAARLEHQPGADPVEPGQKIGALLQHGGAAEMQAAAGHKTHRIAAGMPVKAGEDVIGHGGSSDREQFVGSETIRREGEMSMAGGRWPPDRPPAGLCPSIA